MPVTLTSEGQSYTVQPESNPMTLAPGDYKLSGEGMSESDTYTNAVEEGGAYSLFVVDAEDGKRFAYLIRNNPRDEPVAAST